MKIPKCLQPILWSKSIDKLSPKNDKNYIVHQILMYGDLKSIKWLFDTYSRKGVAEVFINHPKKMYTPSAFNFAKDIVLGLEDSEFEEDRYVRTSF